MPSGRMDLVSSLLTLSPAARTRLLTAIPDVPRWVEARAIVRSELGSVISEGESCVVRNDAVGGRIAVVIAAPTRIVIQTALADRPGRELLCDPEHESLLASWLPLWKREPAYLYQLENRDALAPADPLVRPLRTDETLEHLPEELRKELELARGDHLIYTRFVDDRGVSFAYAHWETEGQYDISIDTVSEYRRRGLARSAASELIRRQANRGLQPVWGAMHSNVASQRLAEGLGFQRVDELTLFTPGQ